jgi:hypothetical protein
MIDQSRMKYVHLLILQHSVGSTHLKRIAAKGFWDVVDEECVSFHPTVGPISDERVASQRYRKQADDHRRQIIDVMGISTNKRKARSDYQPLNQPAPGNLDCTLNTSAVLPTDYDKSSCV